MARTFTVLSHRDVAYAGGAAVQRSGVPHVVVTLGGEDTEDVGGDVADVVTAHPLAPWALGCLLFELLSGRRLFTSHLPLSLDC